MMTQEEDRIDHGGKGTLQSKGKGDGMYPHPDDVVIKAEGRDDDDGVDNDMSSSRRDKSSRGDGEDGREGPFNNGNVSKKTSSSNSSSSSSHSRTSSSKVMSPKSSRRDKSSSGSSSQQPPHYNMHDGGYNPYQHPPPHGRSGQPYHPPHPGMQRGGPPVPAPYPHPHAPPPPHYYAGGHPPPHDPYRGPPPPHAPYHHHHHQMPPPMPPHPSSGHPYPPPPNGYGPPPPNMSGRPGPPPPPPPSGYHPGGTNTGTSSGYPPHGGHPYHYSGNQQHYSHPPGVSSSSSSSSGGHNNGGHGTGPSDSSSITSSKSKRSIKSQSSSSGGESGSRKKRTIDGVRSSSSGAGGGSSIASHSTSRSKSGSGGSGSGNSHQRSSGGNGRGHQETAIPLSYSFRRPTIPTSSSDKGGKVNGKSSQKETSSQHGDHTMDIDSPKQRSNRNGNHYSKSSSRSSSSPFLPPLGGGSSNNGTSNGNNNIFEDPMTDTAHLHTHRRTNSGASTASSLSVGGFSLSSYDGPKDGMDVPMLKASPKRQKGNDSAPLAVDVDRSDNNIKSIFKRKGSSRMANPSDLSIDGAESSRFGQLTMNDSEDKKDDAASQNLFFALSTSPINQPDVDETPMKKNTKKKRGAKITVKTDMGDHLSLKLSPTSARKPLSDTPTPPIPGSHTELLTDEHMLNQHLRGQSFTPLPHGTESGISPSNMGFKLAPSMSWSIAGDTPSLEDIAACSWEESIRSTEKKRPDSTTSQMSAARGLVISPHNFALFKDDHEAKKKSETENGDENKDDGESLRLSMLSPNSEIAGMGMDGTGGTTTPLPLFFRETDSENHHDQKKPGDSKSNHKEVDPMQTQNSYSRGAQYPQGQQHRFFPNHGPPRNDGPPPPPTPPHGGHAGYGHPNMGYNRSPMHGDRRDYGMYGHHAPPPGHGPNDRIRNLRGRMPPGVHMPPMPIHIPPPMSSHHPLTSPMGIPGGKPFWSPSHGMAPPMASPHHMSPMDITQSKRKCIPMKPPIPSKFQGDMDKYQNATVPEFTSLVNFPAHMSQKQAVNLPEGMRCCVMCGQACPCSTGNKKKNGADKKDPRARADVMGDKNGFAIIPTQNKGLCTLCDVNVWVVANNGLEIKWCKGCKNFRPWAAFGDKGLATKCLRCRERQREKYALQKEEKEKARRSKTALATASIKA